MYPIPRSGFLFDVKRHYLLEQLGSGMVETRQCEHWPPPPPQHTHTRARAGPLGLQPRSLVASSIKRTQSCNVTSRPVLRTYNARALLCRVLVKGAVWWWEINQELVNRLNAHLFAYSRTVQCLVRVCVCWVWSRNTRMRIIVSVECSTYHSLHTLPIHDTIS